METARVPISVLAVLDRLDAKKWMEYMAGRLGEDCELLLQGISMGAATVDMAVGLELPPQVRGLFPTAPLPLPKRLFTLCSQDNLSYAGISLSSICPTRWLKEAGYGLDECNARDEVKRPRILMLFIHGSKDTFVPCSMVHELSLAMKPALLQRIF